MLLLSYARSPFRGFESYLRNVVGFDGEDIRLALKQHNSNFVTYQIPPGIYSINDTSEIV